MSGADPGPVERQAAPTWERRLFEYLEAHVAEAFVANWIFFVAAVLSEHPGLGLVSIVTSFVAAFAWGLRQGRSMGPRPPAGPGA